MTTTPDAPKADASPALVVDEAKRAARPARSPEAIDRYIAEERASWDEHDRRIEQCHREAMAQSPPPEREWGQAGGPANTVGERSDPAMRSSVRTIGRRTEPPAGVLRAPTPEETRRFEAWLAEDGIQTTSRATRGRSIMAGCGQLGGESARDPARQAARTAPAAASKP